jgi:hypothetical protein
MNDKYNAKTTDISEIKKYFKPSNQLVNPKYLENLGYNDLFENVSLKYRKNNYDLYLLDNKMTSSINGMLKNGLTGFRIIYLLVEFTDNDKLDRWIINNGVQENNFVQKDIYQFLLKVKKNEV